MSNEVPGLPVYDHYADFLKADPRRRRKALELGVDWRDGDSTYRACWYEDTHELTIEGLDPEDDLDPEDFQSGIAGPVVVLRHVRNRAELSRLLGEWPNIAPGEPRTLERLKSLLGTAPRSRRDTEAAEENGSSA